MAMVNDHASIYFQEYGDIPVIAAHDFRPFVTSKFGEFYHPLYFTKVEVRNYDKRPDSFMEKF